jgi:hypothetical protein
MGFIAIENLLLQVKYTLSLFVGRLIQVNVALYLKEHHLSGSQVL